MTEVTVKLHKAQDFSYYLLSDAPGPLLYSTICLPMHAGKSMAFFYKRLISLVTINSCHGVLI